MDRVITYQKAKDGALLIFHKSPIFNPDNIVLTYFAKNGSDEQKLIDWIENGSTEPIQDVLPFLSADEREYLMTGIPVGEWDNIVGSPDDYEIDMIVGRGYD